jgi:hypothetical protein
MKTRIQDLSNITPEATEQLLQQLKGVNVAIQIGNSFQLSGLVARNFRIEEGYIVADIIQDPSLSKIPLTKKIDCSLGFKREE